MHFFKLFSRLKYVSVIFYLGLKMDEVQRIINQTLSLRTPQKESLGILAQILNKIALSKDMPNEEALKLIQEVRPSVKDFERAFPCICFAIATGVGKTRLMGAMIAYLHAECKIKNFMVLAPNLTIYNKLKTDFTPNTPKYVFPGLNEYVGTLQIITGDDYDQVGGLFDNPNDDRLRINIFNISKIDSDKDARGLPRVRRMAEYLGQSYFDYLSGLDDLVLIMDEAHRYRANAGMAAINELHPVLGIELTATAKSTGAKGKPFKNIAYEYNLAHAITDGFVKKPAIVGRTDFNKNQYDEETLEELKIKDGIKVHESVKAELQVYADNKKVGHNHEAKTEVKQFNPIDVFATPKPERLIHKILHLATNPGDLVLDSFLGSGTTAAVAHKMGRRWIGVEMGDHVYTHCIPRLQKVINGEDQGGITKSVNWQGGGGFKFYELASSLIVKDKYGQQIISDKYNADMLAEAMCKVLGYHYKPDAEKYWKQGYSSEKSFIYTTTMSMQEESLGKLAAEVGSDNLLICCSAFIGNKSAYPNITVKKIPAAILKKCEWGREGYPLNLKNYTPTDKDFEFEEE